MIACLEPRPLTQPSPPSKLGGEGFKSVPIHSLSPNGSIVGGEGGGEGAGPRMREVRANRVAQR
ncbi:hypothetical protein GCM10009105_28430 [Dokdonella soli]|uniref:Uncharacterized protein n=1 Tax=Dokdonella soli TaxID=529810 RepID=A0ABN1IR37_9GAMM